MPMRFTPSVMTYARLGPAIPILDVRHIEEAISFYTDRLGFDVDFRYEKDPENYAGVRRDDVRLHMHRQDDSHFENGTHGRLKFRIPVDDPDALYADSSRPDGSGDGGLHSRGAC